MLPRLQIALDNLDFASAASAVEKTAAEIDIIEVGTILLCAEGKSAVRQLKAAYPDKVVVADAKIADAGAILASMMFDAGADWTTVICCAEIFTVKGALEAARQRNKDVQVELTGRWTFDQAEEWRQVGLEQVVYHRARDAQAAGVGWSSEDIRKVERLCDMGFRVTITGGVTVSDVRLFRGLPIHVFIAGRSIREARDPAGAARALKAEFARYW